MSPARLYAVTALYSLEAGVSAPVDSSDLGPLLVSGRLQYVVVETFEEYVEYIDGHTAGLIEAAEEWNENDL